MLLLVLGLAISLIGVSGDFKTVVPSYGAKGSKVRVEAYNPVGMPARISRAAAENSVDEAWLEYSISNVSGQRISGIYLQVFVGDSEGRLTKIEECFNGEQIDVGATHSQRVRVPGVIDQEGLSVVSATRIVTETGVWHVDTSVLEQTIAAKLALKSEESVMGTYEPHVAISDQDKSEILELMLRDILGDETKAKRLKNKDRVIFLRESVNFTLPQIRDVDLLALNQEEIKQVADNEGRAIYLTYQPLEREGSRVRARLALKEQVARGAGVYVPYKYTFLFTFVRENHRWVIEKSVGYPQS